jgi:glycosyltransferase involved in cell wall biosynthesis
LVIQWWVPFMAPMTAWLLARARSMDIQSTLICHNVLPHEQSRIDQAAVRWALRRADRLIVHTTAQQALAQRLIPGSATSIVPLPSYGAFHSDAWTRERARAQLNLAGNVILFFGLVRPYKGLQDLIDAMPAVLREIDATLLVVGEIWGDAALYHSRVAELGLQAEVQFVDRYVSNEEAAMYFAAADLAVLPYRAATGSAVLQLAFGLGVPVVATRTGGMDEVVQDEVTGYLVEPGNVDGLARAIARFFREEHAVSFRAAIVTAQARFGWNCLVDVITGES